MYCIVSYHSYCRTCFNLMFDPQNVLVVLQHPFIKDYTNKSDIVDLIMESKAEVVEVMEDLTEEEDLREMKVNYL